MLVTADSLPVAVGSQERLLGDVLGPGSVSRQRVVELAYALVAAVKDRPRDPLNGLERPRARKWQSECEVGLIRFLARRPKRRAKPPAA